MSALDPNTNYSSLLSLIEACNQHFQLPDSALMEPAPEVSGWSVGRHLHHLALANGSIPRLIERLMNGRLGEADLEPKAGAREALIEGTFPSGRQAPEQVTPPDDLTRELVERDFGRMSRAMLRIEPLLGELSSCTLRFPHLYYGPLSTTEWLRFAYIHTRHHAQIMDKILAAKQV